MRVTSTCTSLYKEFLFSQNGVDCSSMPYAVPAISPSSADLALCVGGAVYLSVPANTANLDKLIWTRNGAPIQGSNGASYIVVTQKGEYNISMGAAGCNTNVSNKRTITESGTTTPINLVASASGNGVICGTTGKVKLWVSGNGSASVVWFHNGKEEKTGGSIEISGDSSVGEWFAATKDGSCYSKPSKSIQVTKSEAAGEVTLDPGDVLVNGVALNTFTKFCAGGSLDLSILNKQSGITYTWYNGNDVITSNPYIVPSSQSTISLRMVAKDNSDAKCPAEQSVLDADVTQNSTPVIRSIIGNTTLCGGETKLEIEPEVAGNYTYTWYKDGEKMTDTTDYIIVTTPGSEYSATIKNATGCISAPAVKKILNTISDFPVLSWNTNPTEAIYGTKVTMQTNIKHGPAIDYTWTTDNPNAKIIGSGDTVVIQLPPSGDTGTPLKVTVQAQNICGKSAVLEHTITMNNNCPVPALTSQSSLVQNATAGSKVTVAVAVVAGSGVNPSYQWFLNRTKSNTGGNSVGENSASLRYEIPNKGDYYFYCKVTNSCIGAVAVTSEVFTVNASDNPINIPDGSGTLSGKTCFDIAESNFNNDCGTRDSRSANKSNFNDAGVNTQTYTFTVVGQAVSKVRFVYVESESGIVKDLTGGNPDGTNITGEVKATLVYNSNLSSTSEGANNGMAYKRNRTNPLSVDLYVIYNTKNDGSGSDVKIKLTAQIKDCSCCGAYIASGTWKEFMCYNLGVKDQNQNPFSPSPNLIGDYYLWGAATAGRSGTGNGNWTDKGVGQKGSTDPCPPGYRIPTLEEWRGVMTYNTTRSFIGPNNVVGDSGILIGTSLFLPNAGYSYSTNAILLGNGPLYYLSANFMGVFTQTIWNANQPFQVAYIAGDKYTGTLRCMSER
ncbi:Immunoglobulin I-set domain protein [compost metagenome]